MEKPKTLLSVSSDTEVLDWDLAPQKFCVAGLIPKGLSILGGAPKIGKSWFVLDLCLRVSRGEPFLGQKTLQGETLYLCLEDTPDRLHYRLACLVDEGTGKAHFVTVAGKLTDDLEEQILDFIRVYPETVLIVIDTFQMVRGHTREPSYAGDYEDFSRLKRLADSQRVSILLVHHLRKQTDSDPLNKLSGTTGISGAVDSVLVLDKKDRLQNEATLVYSGREGVQRKLELRFSGEKCIWELVADNLVPAQHRIPPEMAAFVQFMEEIEFYFGSNTELAERFNEHSGMNISPKGLKQAMNRCAYPLQELGVTFRSRRSNGQRLVEVQYSAGSDASD